MQKKLSNKTYSSVQMLRGLAALLVVLTHIQFIGYGEFGVDIFFCISAFIMMHISEKSNDNFLLKRAIRIIPLYWGITIITYFAIKVAPGVFHSSVASLEFLLKSLFFIPYTRNGITQPILGVGWTLNYEVFYYFVFYLSTCITHKFRAECSAVFLLLIVLVGLVYHPQSVPVRFFSRPILLEFVLGMYCYKIVHAVSFQKINNKLNTQMALYYLLCVTIVGLVAFMYIVSIFQGFISVNRLFKFGLPASMIFLLTVIAFEGRHKSFKSLLVIGNVSFSLYLTHYYVVFFWDRLIYPFDELNKKSLFVAIIAIVTSLAVAWVSWYLVENKVTACLRRRLNI
jgi:peptidoglycan/LPS O-acetylase OafA/YrhL